MSLKNRDNKNRWRNKTVAFRVSPEEDEQIEAAVRLSGLTKQDYITRRLLCREVVVQGNPKVYKALRDQLAAVLDELRRVEDGAGVDDELLDTIQLIAAIMGGMKMLRPCGGAQHTDKEANPNVIVELKMDGCAPQPPQRGGFLPRRVPGFSSPRPERH